MKKSIISLAILMITSFSMIAQQDHFSLKGLTNNIPDNTVVYLIDGKTNSRIDSAVIQNNQFEFRGNAHPYKECWLQAQHSGKFDYKNIYIENADMVFDARELDFFNATVTGSKLQAQSDELFFAIKEWQDKAMAANDLIPKTPESDKAKRDSLREVRTANFQKSNKITQQFIKDHPDYLISLKYLTFLKSKFSKAEAKELYEGLTDELKQTEEGQSIKFWLEKSIQLAVGGVAPNFELPNLDNKTVSLAQFKGKFVLLEFGASGCGPCRRENPNLLKAYNKYQEKGFEILSVWLDKNKENWANAVAKDNMIWASVCDLKGNNGTVPTIYNVTYIPTNYLLNPQGEVIAKDLRGEALQEELAAVFEKIEKE